MQRAAIYARFSTDLQNEKSTEDQIALCRKFAASKGYSVVAEYQDQAKSGASLHGRDGAGDMLIHAMRDNFDAIIVESLDRLSRDMEDMSGMYKRLNFAGVEIIPVDTGRAANTVEVGLRGLISQLYREDNVHKVRRGMAGLVRRGLSAGGKIYGYRPDPLNKGKLLINEDEAAIVLRIFTEFVALKSTRNISYDLNREAVRPPRGKWWTPSSLNGLADRAAGILRNSIYIGRPTWNKVSMVKNPSTGRRLSRANPPEKWQSADCPELRVVPDELWEQAQALLQARRRERPERARSARRLLSGLLTCGACGSGLSTNGKDKSGRVRLRCSTHKQARACPNPRTFYLDAIENIVLDSLAHHMDEPDLLIEYFKAYEEEKLQLSRGKVQKRADLKKRLTAIDEEINRLVDFVAKGIGNAGVWGAKVDELLSQKTPLEVELAGCDVEDNKIRLHPTAFKKMARDVVKVRRMLAAQELDGNDPAAQIIRDVIGRVTVYAESGKVWIKVDGKLDIFTNTLVCPTMVAEVRYHRWTHSEKPTFSYVFPDTLSEARAWCSERKTRDSHAGIRGPAPIKAQEKP